MKRQTTGHEQSSALEPRFLDHVGRLFGNHNDRRVCVCADQRGHDGRVGHAQTLDAVHAELRVNHSRLVPAWAHLGRAHRMVNGDGIVPDHALPVGVRVLRYGHAPRKRYVMQTAAVPAKRRRPRHGHHKLDALHQRVHVLALRQVIGQDPWILERVGTPQ